MTQRLRALDVRIGVRLIDRSRGLTDEGALVAAGMVSRRRQAVVTA